MLAGLLIFFLSNSGLRNMVRKYLEYRRLMKHKADLTLEQEALQSQLKVVKTSAYVEREAFKLGLARPGVLVYQFPPPKEEDK